MTLSWFYFSLGAAVTLGGLRYDVYSYSYTFVPTAAKLARNEHCKDNVNNSTKKTLQEAWHRGGA